MSLSQTLLLDNSGVTSTYNIYAFVYLTDETSGQTEHKITLSVKARPKPEAFDTLEEAELFRVAIAVVNESVGRAEDKEKTAEAWAHGHEDYLERAQDNAMYYAGVAQEGASQTAKDKTEVQCLAAGCLPGVLAVGGIRRYDGHQSGTRHGLFIL